MKRKNVLIMSDSYKISHGAMYPDGMDLMFDYIEPRKGGKWKETQVAGLQMFVKNYLLTPFTKADIDYAEKMFLRHFGFNVFNRKPYDYILEKYDGYFPVTIKGVPEGMVIPEGNVICTVECNDPECVSVVSFLETSLLRAIW